MNAVSAANRGEFINLCITLHTRWLGRCDQAKGVYEFIFYNEKDLSPRRVCVDRTVPVFANSRGEYCYAYGWTGTAGELWLSLIEKAFAKLYGSYESIQYGYTAIGIANLTGKWPYSFTHSSFSRSPDARDDANVDAVWAKLVWMWNNGIVMGISWKVQSKAKDQGLLGRHAYSILSLYKDGSRRLVKIRNPHARGEWSGPGNESELLRMAPQALAALNITEADDGNFTMYVESVAKYAEGIDGVDCFDGRLPPGRTRIAE